MGRDGDPRRAEKVREPLWSQSRESVPENRFEISEIEFHFLVPALPSILQARSGTPMPTHYRSGNVTVRMKNELEKGSVFYVDFSEDG